MHSRTALVTGAGSGIGRGVAHHLAGLGHAVAVLDIDPEAAEETTHKIAESGGRALAVSADVADEAAVTDALATVHEAFGDVEILVNNAGFPRDGDVTELSADDWDAVLGVHLRGAFLTTRGVLPAMRATAWGRIVNMSSISALAHDGRANYVSAKAGLEAFTKAVAHENAGLGITANAIGPGVVVTGMTEIGARRRGRSIEEHVELLRQTVPVGRVGTAHDIARAVAFFAAEDADFITGQVLYVSGGPHG